MYTIQCDEEHWINDIFAKYYTRMSASTCMQQRSCREMAELPK